MYERNLEKDNYPIDSDPVAIIPAAGLASRISPSPCSKEMIPFGMGHLDDGRSHPKAISHYLLDKFKVAGVRKVFFILRKGKWDIPGYYGDGSMMGMHFAYLMMNLPYGVPYTIDQAYPFVKDSKVMMGFPDMLFGPEDAFCLADKTLTDKAADIVIGLYPPKNERQVKKCDLVQWDEETGRVESIVIKPENSALDHIWIFAIWTPTFTEFMHDFLKRDLETREGTSQNREIHLGHVVQRAISEGLIVRGHTFAKHYFTDIGTPDELEGAFKDYHYEM